MQQLPFGRGEGGVEVAGSEFLSEVREHRRCRLAVIDEVPAAGREHVRMSGPPGLRVRLRPMQRLIA